MAAWAARGEMRTPAEELRRDVGAGWPHRGTDLGIESHLTEQEPVAQGFERRAAQVIPEIDFTTKAVGERHKDLEVIQVGNACDHDFLPVGPSH